MQKVCIGSTIGMLAKHRNMKSPTLVRVIFYKTKDGVLLVPVSGHSLGEFRNIKWVTISSEEYNDRDFDYCDDQVEFRWALRKLGFNRACDVGEEYAFEIDPWDIY